MGIAPHKMNGDGSLRVGALTGYGTTRENHSRGIRYGRNANAMSALFDGQRSCVGGVGSR